MQRTRTAFATELRRLEQRTLGGLDMVSSTLERALEALRHRDLELAHIVVADDDRIDGCYLAVNADLVTLLATEAPIAGDLRLATALVYVIGHVERMGDQCVNLAKMILLAGDDASVDPALLRHVQRMGGVVVGEIRQAKRTFAERDRHLTEGLMREHAAVAQLDREIFRLAVRADSGDRDVSWALSMVLAARALRRIGDNAVDIAEQAAFVVTGRLGGFTSPLRPTA